MASTPFKVVSWSPNDPITSDKLGAMVTNDNWLKDNTVRGKYGAHGVTKTTDVRIACGLVLITSRKAAEASADTSFGNYFSQGCRPIVTTGIVSGGQRKIFATVTGNSGSGHPTRDGFQVNVFVDSNSKTKKISRNFYVSWMAIGW